MPVAVRLGLPVARFVPIERSMTDGSLIDERILTAIERIDTAVARIESVGRRASPASTADPELRERHAQLRTRVEAAITELDTLIRNG